jgi:CBS domain-containing protein
VSQLVRDAMVSEPLALDAEATAQEAGEALTRDEVRAVLVTEGGRLLGVITRKTLVRKVVAPGRDPRTTTLREIAEEPNFTLDSAMPLGDAFALLEEQDLERVPVVEDDKLVGVLSRAVVRRRLAEDEPPPEPEIEP